MAARRSRPYAAARRRGFAMVALITMIALISSYLLASVLTRTSTEVKLDNDQRTRAALQEAKAALIAYAANPAWSLEANNDQPGALPCPADLPAENYGAEGLSCSATLNRLGRFPWKSVGATELRDGSGNLLWYAVSANFRKAPTSTVINSDTAGTLMRFDDLNSNLATIEAGTSSSTQSDIVAVIIAPGASLSGQNRSVDAISSYLECRNAYAGTSNSVYYDTFSSSAPPASSSSGPCPYNSTTRTAEVFNDQIITISRSELMAVVEPVVAARIESVLKPYLTTYASQWSGAYPFPKPFFDQTGISQNTYSGTAGTQYGLLPISDSLSYGWASGSGVVAITGGLAGGVSGVSCASISTPLSGWRCTFNITSINLGSGYGSSDTCKDPSTGIRYRYCMVNPAFTVAGNVNNAGLSLAKIYPTTATDITITNNSGSANRNMSSKAIAASVKSTGVGTFTFSGTHSYTRYNTSSFTRAMAVTIPDRVTASPATSTDDSDTGWFVKQQWYRQTYYAVASGYLPGGTGSCTTGTDCLTVNNLASGTTNNKAAILILLGSPLIGANTSSTRPSATLDNYAEGQNTTPSDLVFAHRQSSSDNTNDRTIVIAP